MKEVLPKQVPVSEPQELRTPIFKPVSYDYFIDPAYNQTGMSIGDGYDDGTWDGIPDPTPTPRLEIED